MLRSKRPIKIMQNCIKIIKNFLNVKTLSCNFMLNIWHGHSKHIINTCLSHTQINYYVIPTKKQHFHPRNNFQELISHTGCMRFIQGRKNAKISNNKKKFLLCFTTLQSFVLCLCNFCYESIDSVLDWTYASEISKAAPIISMFPLSTWKFNYACMKSSPTLLRQ